MKKIVLFAVSGVLVASCGEKKLDMTPIVQACISEGESLVACNCVVEKVRETVEPDILEQIVKGAADNGEDGMGAAAKSLGEEVAKNTRKAFKNAMRACE